MKNVCIISRRTAQVLGKYGNTEKFQNNRFVLIKHVKGPVHILKQFKKSISFGLFLKDSNNKCS